MGCTLCLGFYVGWVRATFVYGNSLCRLLNWELGACWSPSISKVERNGGHFTNVNRSREGEWFRVSYGHGWWSEDCDQEKSTSHFYCLGHGTKCNTDLNQEGEYFNGPKMTEKEGDCFMKGASMLRWTTLHLCTSFSESDSRRYTNYEFCEGKEKKIIYVFKAYWTT